MIYFNAKFKIKVFFYKYSLTLSYFNETNGYVEVRNKGDDLIIF